MTRRSSKMHLAESNIGALQFNWEDQLLVEIVTGSGVWARRPCGAAA